MKSKAELEKDILDITLRINKEFPELSKFIKEMPVNVSDSDDEKVNSKNLTEYYNSLVDMSDEYAKTHEIMKDKNDLEKKASAAYPLYPPSDDIYNKGKKEGKLNPEDLSKNKTPNEEKGTRNEKSFREDMSGDDLDVPGSELDDQQESLGSEDEENNYYSLGGDKHNNLDEDNG